MAFFRIIFFLLIFTPAMISLSGCYDDAFLEAMNEEIDFIAPFDVVLSEGDSFRTTYFAISDTGRSEVVQAGDDASYIDIPKAANFTVQNNIDANDDVVTDNVTGLTWLKCTVTGRNTADTADDCAGTNTKLSWSYASETCSNLDYAGYDDWRLPTYSELFSILDFNHWPLVYSTYFPDIEVTVGDGYWTSTSKLFVEFDSSYESYDVSDYAWIIFFNGGGVYGVNIADLKEKTVYDEDTDTTVSEKQFVRCVRDGR